MEFLEFKAPAIEVLIGTFEIHEPLECNMISDDSGSGPIKLGAELLNCPDDHEKFEFSYGISGFRIMKRAGKKNDGVFNIVHILL